MVILKYTNNDITEINDFNVQEFVDNTIEKAKSPHTYYYNFAYWPLLTLIRLAIRKNQIAKMHIKIFNEDIEIITNSKGEIKNLDHFNFEKESELIFKLNIK